MQNGLPLEPPAQILESAVRPAARRILRCSVQLFLCRRGFPLYTHDSVVKIDNSRLRIDYSRVKIDNSSGIPATFSCKWIIFEVHPPCCEYRTNWTDSSFQSSLQLAHADYPAYPLSAVIPSHTEQTNDNGRRLSSSHLKYSEKQYQHGFLLQRTGIRSAQESSCEIRLLRRCAIGHCRHSAVHRNHGIGIGT